MSHLTDWGFVGLKHLQNFIRNSLCCCASSLGGVSIQLYAEKLARKAYNQKDDSLYAFFGEWFWNMIFNLVNSWENYLWDLQIWWLRKCFPTSDTTVRFFSCFMFEIKSYHISIWWDECYVYLPVCVYVCFFISDFWWNLCNEKCFVANCYLSNFSIFFFHSPFSAELTTKGTISTVEVNILL